MSLVPLKNKGMIFSVYTFLNCNNLFTHLILSKTIVKLLTAISVHIPERIPVLKTQVKLPHSTWSMLRWYFSDLAPRSQKQALSLTLHNCVKLEIHKLGFCTGLERAHVKQCSRQHFKVHIIKKYNKIHSKIMHYKWEIKLLEVKLDLLHLS